jgi:hypothetical protein
LRNYAKNGIIIDKDGTSKKFEVSTAIYLCTKNAKLLPDWETRFSGAATVYDDPKKMVDKKLKDVYGEAQNAFSMLSGQKPEDVAQQQKDCPPQWDHLANAADKNSSRLGRNLDGSSMGGSIMSSNKKNKQNGQDNGFAEGKKVSRLNGLFRRSR